MSTLPLLGRVSNLGRLPIHGRPDYWTTLGRITGASMSLDFTSASIDATLASLGFVFARASTATRINASGVMESVAAGAMRIEHDPVTGAPLGYLCEETSTNHVRNSTMVGVVIGSPGTLPTNWSLATAGLTRTVVDVGVESGVPYVDVRLSGTATSGLAQMMLDANTAIAASASQAWTQSVYMRLVGGSLANVSSVAVGVTYRDAGGAGLASGATSYAVSGGALRTQRATHTATSPASTAYAQGIINISVVNGAAVDITLRIGAPQLEQKAFATSYIPTAGAAVTRQPDALRCSTLASQAWFNQAEGSVVVRARRYHVTASGGLCEWANGSVTNRVLTLMRTNRQSAVEITNASATTGATCLTTHGASDEFRAASAVGPSGNAISLNGGAVGVGGSAPVGSGYTTFDIGRTAWEATYFGGTIARLDYYNRRLSNAELQALTA